MVHPIMAHMYVVLSSSKLHSVDKILSQDMVGADIHCSISKSFNRNVNNLNTKILNKILYL